MNFAAAAPLATVTTNGQSSPDDDWEPLDLSSTEYARKRREMMQLINDLRSLGAETLMDLPSIVVIGGQSAGKSSLVEAVSGVNVPRDSGTCTRCPMECTMSSSATTWSCSIKLRFDYDSSGRSALQQKEVAFGPTITDEKDVDIWLRRAQAAILNPNLAPESFHRKTIQDLRNFSSTGSLKFSRNVVSIFIEDPNATDLSFVDLPGLIQNEDQKVVDLVRQLTESYISRPNTIILTTIPMSDDMQNQLSVKLARQADPAGERTIGILTKPDMLGDGAVNSRKLWRAVIEGHQHPLKHGYYCVRLPDDSQREQRLSKTVLQRIAATYFDTTAPWNEVADRGRFGIPAFVKDISVLLVSHINRVIPQLRQNVDRLLAGCMEEMSTLPPPLGADPQIEVLARVNRFCDAFKGAVSGTGPDKSLAQRNLALYNIFARDVRGTAPDFRPFEDPSMHAPLEPLDSEERHSVNTPVEIPASEVRNVSPLTECVACEEPPTEYFEAQAREGSPVGSFESEECDRSSPEGEAVEERAEARNNKIEIMGVYDIRRTIKESTGWELPGNVPYEAKTRLISRFTTRWSAPADKCLTAINDVLDDITRRLIRTHFGRFRVLQDLISTLICPDVEEHKNRVRAAVQETLGIETTTPIYCRNLKDFEDLRERWLNKYRKARRDVQMGRRGYIRPDRTSPESQALIYLAQAGYTGLTVEDLARLIPQDEFEDELIVMADVRAYFTLACKRIIDGVPLKIHQALHQALAEELSASLLQRLISDATSTGNFADRMKELVSEDPATQAKRARLESKQHRLQEMKRKLVNFIA